MSIMPLQKPQSRNSEVTSAKVIKRFFPSAVLKRLPDLPVDSAFVTGAIMDYGVRFGFCGALERFIIGSSSTTSSFSFLELRWNGQFASKNRRPLCVGLF